MKSSVINRISYSNVRALVKGIVRLSDKKLHCTHKENRKETVSVGVTKLIACPGCSQAYHRKTTRPSPQEQRSTEAGRKAKKPKLQTPEKGHIVQAPCRGFPGPLDPLLRCETHQDDGSNPLNHLFGLRNGYCL